MAKRFFKAYGSSHNTSMMAFLDRKEPRGDNQEDQRKRKKNKSTRLIFKEDTETSKKPK